MRLTRDDEIIVFHDADASRLCGSPLRIAQSSLAQLKDLRIGPHPIPTLGELLALVRGQMPMLLEVKVQGDVPRWAPALKQALADYSGPYGVMSFDPRIARQLKKQSPNVRRGLVIRHDLAGSARRMAMWLADPQFISVERAALDRSWVAQARRRMPVYSWTVRTAHERAQAAVHADALIWEGDGRPRI